jgi:enoyl-CoA hydratase/carnithine racemase
LSKSFFQIEEQDGTSILRLTSEDGTNRLTRSCVLALIDAMDELASCPRPLIVTGNERFFSAGADLAEIANLSGQAAYDEQFPSPVYAAVSGYCMGGGLDLALACHHRIADCNAVFGHRGAALGLITGWGGTQRLPRLIGKRVALELFLAAEKISAARAKEIGLVEEVAEDPVAEALRLAACASI